MAKYKYFNTNWHDTMLRDAAPQYRTNLSVSGGNARARYYVSFSYLRQEGLFDTKWTEWNEGYSTQEPLQPAFEHRHRCKQVSECIDGLGRTYRQYLPTGH